MLGNYSFVIKALDPQNNTVKEGFKFAKPITIAMFYDVDNLVKANSKHVNNELTMEDIDPVLYLWDSNNGSWWVNPWKDFKNETLKRENYIWKDNYVHERSVCLQSFCERFQVSCNSLLSKWWLYWLII